MKMRFRIVGAMREGYPFVEGMWSEKMELADKLRYGEEMLAFLRASMIALGLSPNSVLRFPDLFQIAKVGIDVVWEDVGSPTGGPGWVLRQTYTELIYETEEIRIVTEVVIASEAHETSEMARAAALTIAERIIDSALSEVTLA